MIKFGTDGWRAKIAEDFTFDNVRLVTSALVSYLKNTGLANQGVAVGYDNRFESEDFAACAAEECAGAGIKTYLSKIPLPSPALSYFVKSNGLGSGIMITASHNPPEWNGFKIKESFGGSARPEVTKAVEAILSENLFSASSYVPQPANKFAVKIESFNPKPEYLKHISSFVDLDAIKNANLKIILDPMHGSAAGYLKDILDLEEINQNRDPLFGGVNPEPIPQNLEDLTSLMKDTFLTFPDRLSLSIVLDGDGDRIGCVDPSGVFISSHNIFSLILKHLVENKNLKGKVVKTFNISRLVEYQAKKYNLSIDEVPIGFKYIADKMLAEKVLIGGEESGGMGILGNIPERDGSLSALLLLELMAHEKKTLKQILDEIMDEFGYFTYDRIDLRIEKEKVLPKIEKLKSLPEFAGSKITRVETLDGVKLNFEDKSWILFRPSGTEPLLRIYSEGKALDQVEFLLSEGQKHLTQ